MTGLETLTSGAVLAALLAGVLDTAPEPAPGEGERTTASRVDPTEERTLSAFQARPDEPVRSFRARRLMRARGVGKEACMVALVELDPEDGFRWAIEAESGSALIRNKALRSMLEKEAAVRGAAGDSTALTAENYEFRKDGRESDGRVRLRAVPRRREAGLIDGSIVVAPDTADLVRMEGRLARAPSLWIPRVEVVRHFRRLRGHRVVVRIESVAHVRFSGAVRLTIDIDYDMIDGDTIEPEPAPGSGLTVAEAAPPADGRTQEPSRSFTGECGAEKGRRASRSPRALEEGVLVNGLVLSAAPRPGQPPTGMTLAGVDSAQPVSGTTSDTPQSSRGAHEFP